MVKTYDVRMYSQFFLCLVYVFYFFHDLIFGPRFYVFLAPILLLITARTVFPDNGENIRPEKGLAALLVFCICVSLPFRLPSLIKRFNPSSTITGTLKRELQ